MGRGRLQAVVTIQVEAAMQIIGAERAIVILGRTLMPVAVIQLWSDIDRVEIESK